jgi:HlyD family secretion protein
MRRRLAYGICVGLAAALLLSSCGRGDWRTDGSGTIELDEVDVGSLVGGRVQRLLVAEGDRVRAGDTLAVLERGEVSFELEARRAEAERAAALWRDQQRGPRQAELEAARAELAGAEATLRLARIQEDRARALVARAVVPQAELDRAQAEREAAEARVVAARERVRLFDEGFRREQIEAAREASAAARAQSGAADSRARELVLTAPIDGVVLVRAVEPGEIVPPNTAVLTLGNPDRLWMRVYVAAPRLARVRLGDRAEVRVQGVDRTFPGRVVEIHPRAEFTPRAALTEEERANLVFGVKVELEPSDGVLKSGLPAEARFLGGGSREAGGSAGNP